VAGPSLDILKADLVQATTDYVIPYAATMSQYVTPEEAAARWANLTSWVAQEGHFWVGTGPFYLDKVFPVEGTLTLLRNEDFPDLYTKWQGFAEPKIATVEVDGPGQVTIGTEAMFDVFITFQGEPYPQAELDQVGYLLYDATGNLVSSGPGTAVADGQYQVTLPADLTGKLAAGSNKLEVVVTSKIVSIPAFGTYEFVTVAP
jgi:peptide/nickel transport system substrate-binding protein